MYINGINYYVIWIHDEKLIVAYIQLYLLTTSPGIMSQQPYERQS